MQTTGKMEGVSCGEGGGGVDQEHGYPRVPVGRATLASWRGPRPSPPTGAGPAERGQDTRVGCLTRASFETSGGGATRGSENSVPKEFSAFVIFFHPSNGPKKAGRSPWGEHQPGGRAPPRPFPVLGEYGQERMGDFRLGGKKSFRCVPCARSRGKKIVSVLAKRYANCACWRKIIVTVNARHAN